MEIMNSITSEFVHFGRDVVAAYNNLSFGSRVVIGGSVGCYLLNKYGKFAALALLALPYSIRKIFRKKREFKDGVLYVHVYPRKAGKRVCNISPFAVKLESWLRLHNVEFELVETLQLSKSTQQTPFMIYNGKEYADTELIIDFLLKERNIKEAPLSPEEMGIQRAFIAMLDDKLSFTILLYRYCYAVAEFSRFGNLFGGLPQFIRKFVQNNMLPAFISPRMAAQGVGRKPRDAVIDIANKDLKALSLYLGDKKFLFGDKISRADCSAFGNLIQFFYVDLPYPCTEFMRHECANLEQYINRIKTELWPDWDDIVDNSEF